MPNNESSEAVDVPRPVALFLIYSYLILLIIGFTASFFSAFYLLWKKIFKVCLNLPYHSAARASSDKEIQRDERLVEAEVLLELQLADVRGERSVSPFDYCM